MLAIRDFKNEDIENVLKRTVYCQKKHHENKELKFFCKQCEVSICNTCVVTFHESHDKVLLQDAANEKKLSLESAIESQKEKVLQKKNLISKLQNEYIQIQGQVTNIRKSAQSFVDNLIKVVEEKKMEILKNVEEKANESFERLAVQQSQVENEIQLIETSIDKTETFLKRSSGAEIMRFNTVYEEAVSDGLRKVEDKLEDPGNLVFIANKKLIDQVSSDGVGSFFLSRTNSNNSGAVGKGITDVTVGLKAQFVLTTRNAENKRCYEQFNSVNMEIRNDQGHDCATGVQVQDNKHGSYNISYFAKEAGAFRTSVMVNGEHVSGSPFTVQVKPRQYKPVLSFGRKGSSWSTGKFDGPWGVAVNERNEIAVTDSSNTRVQIFSCNGKFIGSFGKKGVKKGEFKKPVGIAYLNNGNIVVADTFNDRLQIFTERGECLAQIGSGENPDHQFDSPMGLSVDSYGNIIVADSDNKLIKIFTSSGQFLRKFGGEDLLVDPYHCIQKDQYFIVSDPGDHCIKVFNTEGVFLYKFGNKGDGDGDGEFYKPRCLSVDKAEHLVVCDYGNNRVQVLDLSGKFITKIRVPYGGEIGPFQLPTSTAVLTDGRIVLTDYCNDRMLIIE